jgi:hypothetical protein
MPKFLIEVTRHLVEIESASITVEAADADAALALAKDMDDEDELEFAEDDKGYSDNYTWTVTAGDG